MKKKLIPGDVLEVAIPDDCLGYLLYLGKHHEYGDTVLVVPGTFDRPPTDFSKEFQHAYVTFYPVTAALAQKLVRVVAKEIIPTGMPPRRLRRAGARSGTRIDSWVIEDESGEYLKTKLSEDELRLPIAAIWNHELLLKRITTKWRPELEGSN